MYRALIAALLATTSCSSSSASLPEGSSEAAPPIVDPNAREPRVIDVADGAGRARFDDLRWATRLGKVLAAPGNAAPSLVDRETLALTRLEAASRSTTSMDEAHGFVIAADGGQSRVAVFDPKTGALVGQANTSGAADYLRWSETTREILVTEPGNHGIEFFYLAENETTPKRTAFITVDGGPEGIAIDRIRGRAYAHRFDGPLVVIDLAKHAVIATWDTGCSGTHGIPAVDEERGFVFAGCRNAETVAFEANGKVVGRYKLPEGGESILAYSTKLRHVYLRGDPGKSVAVLRASDTGALDLVGTFEASPAGHGIAADDHGNVWVCDSTHGTLMAFRDSFDVTSR